MHNCSIITAASPKQTLLRAPMNPLSRKDLILLILLTVFWGINWPIMKLGVQQFPPLTFRALCMLGGLPLLWAAARWQGLPLSISRAQLLPVLTLATPNMLVWHLCVIVGVKMLSSGRAAILGFTMPVWAVLFGLLLFGERLSRLAWFGIACALAGALLLLSSEIGAISGQPLGSVLVLVAAMGWGYGTVMLKRSTLNMPTLTLTFWMMALTTVIMLLGAALFESEAWRMPNGVEWAAIVYNAAMVFGFAHVVWFDLARKLPPIASSLSVMMIPVVGVFSGAWMLGEVPHWQDYAAMLLILVAMCSVLLKPPAAAAGMAAQDKQA